MVMPQVIDLLGVVTRAEAAYYDDPGGQSNPSAVLFTTSRGELDV